MGLFLKKNINNNCILGLWEITEDFNTLFTKLSNNITKEESNTLNNFKNEKRKLQWLSTRILLNELLNFNTKINYDKFGKPFLQKSSYNISISHSKDFVAIILGKNHQVGIDIEFMSNKIERVASKYLDNTELASVVPENKILHLYVYWCAKETLYKIHSKKNINFINNLIISPFELKEKGQFKGTINTNSSKKEYLLNYFTFNNYVLVWCFNLINS